MPRTLPRIEEYFPYVTHKLSATKRDIGIRAYTAFSNWVFSGKTYEGLEATVAHEQDRAHANRIFLGRHLSEFDWAEIQLQFVTHDVKTIIQSGANLFIGPFDPLLRKAGGFKVFREETVVYDPNWLMNILKGFLEGDLKIDINSRLDITKDLAERIYDAFYKKSLLDGYNVLEFVEYARLQDGSRKETIKYGRSYTGILLPFSPVPLLIPYFFQRTHPEMDLAYQAVTVTYERTPEDQNFARLEYLKAQGASSKRVYVEDYLWNLTFRFHQRASRVHIAFGLPIPIKELPGRGITSRKKLAPYLRDEVGLLSVLYPTQLVGIALDPVMQNDGMGISDLKARMARVRDEAEALGERYVQHVPEDMDAALEQAHEQFWQPNKSKRWTREIVRLDGQRVAVHRPDVLMQYANHCRHLFPGGKLL